MWTRRAAIASLAGGSRLFGGSSAGALSLETRLNPFQQLVIPVRLNRSRPLWCVLDSGAGAFVSVARETADAIGLMASSEDWTDGPGGRTLDRTGRTVALLTSGNVNLGAATVLIRPVPLPAEGAIGMFLLRRYVIELDSAAPAVRLHDAAGFRYAGPGRAIPFRLEPAIGTIPWVDVVLTVRGERIPATFRIDTGAPAVGMVTRAFLSRQKIPARELRVERLEVGGYSVSHTTLLPGGNWSGGAEPDGMLGIEFLRRFRVWMDYRRSEMIWEPDSRYRAPISV